MNKPDLTPQLVHRLMQARSIEERIFIAEGGSASPTVRRSLRASSADGLRDGTTARRRYAKALRWMLDRPLVRSSVDDLLADRLLHVQRLRAKHQIQKLDPRVVTAMSQHRMRGW